MNKKRALKAFSLIELSIVILVIGILIAATISGTKLISRSRIISAQSLTKSSPVAGISDLMLWYETSTEESFEASEAIDGEVISTWHDINPQTAERLDATQTVSGTKPLYISEVVNSLPVIRFDGSNDFMDFNGKYLSGSQFTVFLVSSKRGSNVSNFILGTKGGGSTFRIGYYNSNFVGEITAGSSFSTPIENLISKPSIYTVNSSNKNGIEYWINGGINPYSSIAAYGRPAPSTKWTIANYYSQFANIDVAEIIIFTRRLKTVERRSIEKYLGKKYNIKTK